MIVECLDSTSVTIPRQHYILNLTERCRRTLRRTHRRTLPRTHRRTHRRTLRRTPCINSRSRCTFACRDPFHETKRPIHFLYSIPEYGIPGKKSEKVQGKQHAHGRHRHFVAAAAFPSMPCIKLLSRRSQRRSTPVCCSQPNWFINLSHRTLKALHRGSVCSKHCRSVYKEMEGSKTQRSSLMIARIRSALHRLIYAPAKTPIRSATSMSVTGIWNIRDATGNTRISLPWKMDKHVSTATPADLGRPSW